MQHLRTACLVTGGAGFIGSHLAHRLVELGATVRVVDNLSTGDEANLSELAGTIDFVRGDLRDPDVCDRAVSDVEMVFHVAALPSVPRSLRDPWGTHDSNVNGTVHLLQACQRARVRRVVYSSSSSVYGDTLQLPKNESAELLPRSPYAASKLAGEQYVLAFARAGLVEGVALRYFNVFGPRQSPDSPYAAVIPLFLNGAMRGIPVTLYGDGSQTRDFTYIDNVVAANILAAIADARQASGSAINVGAGERTSLRELLALVRSVTGFDVAYVQHPPREGDVRHSLASLDRAGERLGYSARVSLIDGLRHTWEWMCRRDARLPGDRVVTRRVAGA